MNKDDLKVVELRSDAKDIHVSVELNKGCNKEETYIYYVSESHPKKNCIHVIDCKTEHIKTEKNKVFLKIL